MKALILMKRGKGDFETSLGSLIFNTCDNIEENDTTFSTMLAFSNLKKPFLKRSFFNFKISLFHFENKLYAPDITNTWSYEHK